MVDWLIFEESLEGYGFSKDLNAQLNELLNHFEKKDESQSLREDIERLGDICNRYSNKKIVYIYQYLMENGYYMDEYYLLKFGEESFDGLLKAFIRETIKDSENSVIKTLMNDSRKDLINQLIKKNKAKFESQFIKKFISSCGAGIYYLKRKKGLIDLILHLPTEKIYQLYLQSLRNRGLSQTTIKNYSVDIRLFLKWLEERKLKYSDLDRSIAKKYLDVILKKHKISSYNKILLSLSSFNKYLVLIGVYKQLFFLQTKDQIKDLTSKNVEVFTEKEQEDIIRIVNEKELD